MAGNRLDFFQSTEQLFNIRLLVQWIDFGKTDRSLFIDHVNRSFGKSILKPEDAVQLGNVPVRIEITQKRVGNPGQAF